MKQRKRLEICLAGGLALGASTSVALADASENPYQGIIERNVFALKDPPPPPDPNSLKPPPPVIKLQGITTLFGRQQVLFRAQMPAKPPKPAEEIAMILSVGQREGEYEVLEINEKEGTVKFNNHGTEETKSLDKDGIKPAGGVVAAPTPGVVPTPGVPTPVAATRPNPGAPPMGGGFAGSTLKNTPSIPTRTLRMPSTPAAGGVPAPGTMSGGIVPGVPTPTAPANPQANPPQRVLTPEEQIVLMALERERNKNNPDYPPVPPLPGVDE